MRKLISILFLALIISIFWLNPLLATSKISNLKVATKIDSSGRPVDPADKIDKKAEKVYFTFDILDPEEGDKIGLEIEYIDENKIVYHEDNILLIDDKNLELLKYSPAAYIFFDFSQKDTSNNTDGYYRTTILVNGKKSGSSVDFEIGDFATAQNVTNPPEEVKINQVLLWSLGLIFTLIPSFFWLWIYRRKDRADPEPRKLIAKLFLFGALGALPIGLLEIFAQSNFGGSNITFSSDNFTALFYLFLYTFTLIAPIEEGGKFLVTKIFSWKSPAFNQIIDGVIYCVSAALGFALVENALYFGSLIVNANKIVYTLKSFGFAVNYSQGITYFYLIFAFVFAVRFLLSTLAHTLFSGTVGFYMGKARFDPENANRLIGLGLFIAILAHGAFNFMLMVNWGFYSMFLVIIMAIFLFIQFRREENLWIRDVASDLDTARPIYQPNSQTGNLILPPAGSIPFVSRPKNIVGSENTADRSKKDSFELSKEKNIEVKIPDHIANKQYEEPTSQNELSGPNNDEDMDKENL